MEDKQHFLEIFRSVFDETDPEDIQLNTVFKNLEEWSSLTLLALVVTIEENFKKEVSAKEIEKASRVEDLYNLVKSGLK